jgi:hydrogenase assembly chaperone HypC/HupF
MSDEPEKAAGIPTGTPVSDSRRFEPIGVEEDSCMLNAEGHCITCSDEARPARVLHIDQELGTALVEIKNETEEVDIMLVDEVMPGDWLLVHGGVAIANMMDAENHSSVVDEGSAL